MQEEQLNQISTSSASLVIGSLDQLPQSITQVCQRLIGDSVGPKKQGKPLLYVSLNERPQVIAARLVTDGIAIGSVTFVDTIAPPPGQTAKADELNVRHTQNLADLTALHMAVSDMVAEHSSEASIVIDALATLLIYNEQSLVVKFIRDVVETSRQARTVVFTPPDGGVGLLEKISPHFDVVFNLTTQPISSVADSA